MAILNSVFLIGRRARGFEELIAFKTKVKTSLLNKIAKANAYNESGAYDGDGKTTADVLQKTLGDSMNLISGYSNRGFRLSNNVFAIGSIIVLPTHVYGWNVKKSEDITMDSLTLFDLLLPKLKLLIIGYGSYGDKYDSSIPGKLRERGIGCEMLPTVHATTTYNFLAADAVHVAAALVPPSKFVGPAGQPVDSTMIQEDEDYLGGRENWDEKENLESLAKYRKARKGEDTKIR